jgi:hypothetical protein
MASDALASLEGIERKKSKERNRLDTARYVLKTAHRMEISPWRAPARHRKDFA